MPEREYYGNEWDDFFRNTGGDPTYGGGLGQPPGAVAPPPPGATAPTTPAPTTTTPPPGGGGGKTREQIIAEGQEFDRQNGLMGGYFDEQRGIWVNGSPHSGGGGSGYGGSGDAGGGFDGFDFGAPPEAWNWPQFNAPRMDPISPFVFEKFAAPTMEQAENEPGYAFAKKEGVGMIGNTAAGRGLARSAGTLKDFIKFGNSFAEQNYGNVFNRARDVFNTNEGNRFAAFNTNTDNQFKTFDRNYRSAWDEFSPRMDASKLEFQERLDRWKSTVAALAQMSQPVF